MIAVKPGAGAAARRAALVKVGAGAAARRTALRGAPTWDRGAVEAAFHADQAEARGARERTAAREAETRAALRALIAGNAGTWPGAGEHLDRFLRVGKAARKGARRAAKGAEKQARAAARAAQRARTEAAMQAGAADLEHVIADIEARIADERQRTL